MTAATSARSLSRCISARRAMTAAFLGISISRPRPVMFRHSGAPLSPSPQNRQTKEKEREQRKRKRYILCCLLAPPTPPPPTQTQTSLPPPSRRPPPSPGSPKVCLLGGRLSASPRLTAPPPSWWWWRRLSLAGLCIRPLCCPPMGMGGACYDWSSPTNHSFPRCRTRDRLFDVVPPPIMCGWGVL